MLDLDAAREGVTPKDAATLVLLRDGDAGKVEVFCVERHAKSAFLGGAIVFPGGKVDASDRDAAWLPHLLEAESVPSTDAQRGEAPIAADAEARRALRIAACRETLEEAAMLPLAGAEVDHAELLALRRGIADKRETLIAFLAARNLRLDLAALHPFARWVTPTAEARRFDTRFFVTSVTKGQRGAHDEHETTASFWATPDDILARFDDERVQLAPPTHRTLTLLRGLSRAADAAAFARAACLDPICPRLVPQEEAGGNTLALALPGDPDHEVRVARVAGASRFVLRGARWLPENAPKTAP